MKKTLLALGLMTLAGIASAQSNVTIYGKMRVYHDIDKSSGTAASVDKVTQSGSRLGFKGSEDLGGGLKANFTVETNIAADAPSATSLGDRTSIVGLSNQFGSLDLGRDKHSIARMHDAYDAMGGNNYGSSAISIHANHGDRVQNAAFATITPIKGVKVSYQQGYSESATLQDTQAGAIEAKIGFVDVMVASYDSAANTSSTAYAVKAEPVAGTRIMAIYSNDEVAGVKTDGKSIGVQQDLFGKWVAMASYGTKQDLKAYSVGANYILSKRTTLNVRYKKEDATLASLDKKNIGFGIEHNF
jgi:predicted porin